ncbi:MAG: T9SS type A sorting domain-containing protein [Cytophagaceae bacterium]|nr:T9SS type A sorting domain-containing protein [Cytophagaceae bacterium]
MKKLFILTLCFLSFLSISAKSSGFDKTIKNENNSYTAVSVEIESIEQLQELLPQIEQELFSCNAIEIRIVNPLEAAEEHFVILRSFGEILMTHEENIIFIWQGNFVYPAQSGIALSHYEWWRWNRLKLGVNPVNGAKWQIESVELYLFASDTQPETLFDVVETPYEAPFYITEIEDKLEFQTFPRPRDSYNYHIYPGFPGWDPQASIQIPPDTAEAMSTQALLQALWELPGLLFIIDTRYHMRFGSVSNTNTYNELKQRPDFGTALIYRLSMLNTSMLTSLTFIPTLELQAFQIIMSQPEILPNTSQPKILSQLSDNARKQLLRAIFQYDALLAEKNPLYYGRQTVWFLTAETLRNADYAPFLECINENEALKQFLELINYDCNGLSINSTVVQLILEHAEEYLKEGHCCENINNLALEQCSDNSIILSWSKPESELTAEGYSVYRNDVLLNGQPIAETSYTDDNLPAGIYCYYAVAHYTNGYVSERSNYVTATVNSVGITEITDTEKTTVFPNPVKNMLMFSTPKRFEIIDAWGRTVLKSETTALQSVNVGHLPTGIYFIRFADNHTAKFVKE